MPHKGKKDEIEIMIRENILEIIVKILNELNN